MKLRWYHEQFVLYGWIVFLLEGETMIDLNKCKIIFEGYIKNYDMNNFKIRQKRDHTFRVMNFCRAIAISLNLKEEDINIASLIGLLHDIGRFEQLRIYDTFNDNTSVDHAILGVEILKMNYYIQEYVMDIEVQELILTAIENHNKLTIDDGLDERTLLFCKIIRDADKLDILYLYQMGDLKINSDLGAITDDCFTQLMSCNSVNKKDVQTNMDHTLLIISFLFDFNFSYSFQYLKYHNSINWIVDELIKYNPNENQKLLKIKELVNNYLEKRGK